MVNAIELPRIVRPADGLCVVGASAGSGKTYHLTQLILGALRGSSGPALDIESLVAVTYTTRAATELRSRIRRELVTHGSSEGALRLPLARLGTVHAVCLSWVEDFAVDAGLPPGVRVLPDDGGVQFRQLLEEAIPSNLQARMSELGRCLQVKWDSGRQRSDWLWQVFELIELARANRIAPSALPAMAQRSAVYLAELLPTPSERDLDGALGDALDRAVQDVQSSSDATKKTQGVLERMRGVQRALARGRASWADWAVLAALEPGKKSQELVAPVSELAAELEAHPRFQREMREMLDGVFECARLGLERYQAWKERLRLVDYVDMLERALGLLDRPEVARELAERLGLLVVDEFQDTSPVQLELFLRLHQLTGRSTWVGDRKQCIFEFAGADPQLMDSVARWVADSGGTTTQLPHNYRSRPELVAVCSELFTRALAPYGYTRAEVAVTPRREVPGELAGLPPLGLLSLECRNAEQRATALASGIQRILTAPEQTRVVDRHTDELRPVRPGDIAVLVRTNAEAENLARALGRLRIRAALPRPGLLKTPEGTLVDAALSFLLDPTDTVAAGIIDALLGFDGDPDRWLEHQIVACHARWDATAAAQAARTQDAPLAQPANDVTFSVPLTGLRATLSDLAGQTRQLSPRETLDCVIEALDLERLVRGWPEPEQRSGNLDALRALANQYEETCRVTSAAPTLAGMLHYFDRVREARWDGNEMRANDEQHFSQGPDAVVICTYHRSKGLEWPVVILSSLGAGPRADAFGVKIQAPDAPLDPERPLEGRWIRYVPRPFAGRSKNLGFLARELQSAPGGEARRDEQCERARLLYVGFTRARDHLIFAAERSAKAGHDTRWLDELRDAAGSPLLPLADMPEGDGVLPVAGVPDPVPMRVWHIDIDQPTATVANDTASVVTWRRPSTSHAARELFRIAPSRLQEAADNSAQLHVGELIRVGPSLSVQRSGNVDRAKFGDTVHRFLATDRGDEAPAVRQERARRLLDACASGATLDPAALVGVGDALRAFVETRWPGAVRHPEIPIRLAIGAPALAQRLSGTIDLLLETHDSYVLIDHKTFGNPTEAAIREHAKQYVAQLAAYGSAVNALGGKPVRESWLHFGVAGVCVALTR